MTLGDERMDQKLKNSKIQSQALPPTTEGQPTTVGEPKTVGRPTRQPVTEIHPKDYMIEPKNLVDTPPTKNVHFNLEDTLMSGDKSLPHSGCSTKRRIVAKQSE